MGMFSKLKGMLFEEVDDKEEIEEEKLPFEPLKKAEEKEVKELKKEYKKEETQNLKRSEFDLFDDKDFSAFENEFKKREFPKKEVNSYEKDLKRNSYDNYDFKIDKTNELFRENKAPKKEFVVEKQIKEVKVIKPEEKENKSLFDQKNFRPSPIISPVHGIVKKTDEVKVFEKKKELSEKKEDNIKTYVTPTGIRKVESKIPIKKDYHLNKEEKEDDVIELEPGEVPKIDKVTISEAREYYNDLGLEYNVNYNDKSLKEGISYEKETLTDEPKHSSKKSDEKLDVSNDENYYAPGHIESLKRGIAEIPVEETKYVHEEVKGEKGEIKRDILSEVKEVEELPEKEDLFNLIESMYEEK